MNPNMYLNVSIHDISPVHQEEVDTLFALVESLGVKRGTLLVVPDFHGQSPLRPESNLVKWLSKLGPSWEIALHGFSHQDDFCRERPNRRLSPLEYLISHYYTQTEGEFYLLPYREALRRMKSGIEVLKRCGLEPKGFVAPAWLFSYEAFQAARNCEFKYTTSLRHVFGFSKPRGQEEAGRKEVGRKEVAWKEVGQNQAPGKEILNKAKVMAPTRGMRSGRAEAPKSPEGYMKYSAPAITFSTRSLLRAHLSKVIVPYLARKASGCHLVRLALHPKDTGYSFILQLISELIKMLLENRESLTIGEYVEGKGNGLGTWIDFREGVPYENC